MYGRMMAAAAAALLLAGPALAQDKIKIGFLTTLTTPAAIIGEDQRKAVELALDHMGRKMGKLDVEIVYADDEFNPQKGKQATEKLVTSDKVDIVDGYLWSNVLLASAPVVLDADKILISANAGPSQLAGKDCHPNFFNVSWQNDQTPMAMGELLNKKGVKSLYTISPNYAAGKDMVAGVKRTFKGTISGEDYTTWPAQMDWAAEFTKAKSAKPDGVFAFYPGAHGPAFLKQWEQAGLGVPLYTVYTIDSIALPRLQQAGMKGIVGQVMTQFWVQDLPNAQNKRFVADFLAKHKVYPSFYAAQAYDSIFLIKAAVEAAGGLPKDAVTWRKALRGAKWDSVRGKFKFGTNQFPVQDFWSLEIVADKDGNWTTKALEVVLKDHVDPSAPECKMPQ